MAKVVKNHKFTEGSARNKYPWGEWLNGQIWALTAGEDFDVSAVNLVNNAKSYASRHRKTLNTQIETAEDGSTTVYIQATITAEDAEEAPAE